MFLHITRSVIFILVILFPLLSFSKIMDGISCVSCHTMHNRQSGSSMTPAGMAAQKALLNNSCVGCHSGTNTDPATTGIPFVYDPSAEPSYVPTGTSGNDTLAGGNFWWVVNISDRKGHNVFPIAAEDDIYGPAQGAGRPVIPGSDPPTLLTAATQLTCAGATGCHGNGAAGDIESLRPASHHIADDPTLGTSVANSFRFLSGIKGIEAPDWEFVVTPALHNQYKGTIGGGTDTISSLCARCHGDFHLTGTTPFLRHPTDVDLPEGTTEYAAYTSYKPETPVASDSLAGVLNDVQGVASNRIVSCISCHRAHGSPFDGLLRWDYKSWPGGGYDGCGECHSTKN